KMFCPWDVLSYVNSCLDGTYSRAIGLKNYWVNTSETSVNLIHGFFGKTPGVNECFEQLLAGESVKCSVNENLPYHLIHANGDNLLSALLETGYLTKTNLKDTQPMRLRIPNRSIQVAFQQEGWNFFRDKVDNVFVEDLVNALWAGEVERAEKVLNQILEATLSFYHVYHEYSYHLILAGLFTGIGYRIQSERETGYGRSDLIILQPSENSCMILELKHVKKEEDMADALKEGSSQIIRQKYGSAMRYEGYTTRLQYVMSFSSKRVIIAKVEEEV
ncbi:MAG: PD-(D/E)XK nuclease domain-containing protein, partial [Clostridia bacterium]|nr:PD-(D/E)XK nuclease domain-containing protein [Clostridia bacterium]